MTIAPLADCVGKLLRKGRSMRLVAGLTVRRGEGPRVWLHRPTMVTHIAGYRIYEDTTFAELRQAISQAKGE